MASSSERILLHIDMDAFFAAVETLSNPALRGKPVVVGGMPGGRGAVATASYEARRYGIHPGMAISSAVRLCPEAIFLPGSPPKYLFNSIQLLELLRRFSPLVEPFSIDEAFVELSGANSLKAGEETAFLIQNTIEEHLRLTASIGVGPNKFIAKMASRVVKPRGITVLDREEYRRHFGPKPVSTLWGVGEKTASALAALDIHTIDELARHPRTQLLRVFGVVGGLLREMARGHDDTPIIPYYQGVPVKSMGHEFTFPRDESDPARIEAMLFRLTEQVARRLRLGSKQGRTVEVKIRFSDYRTIIRQSTLKLPTDEERIIYPIARSLLHLHARAASLRLIGIAVSGLVSGHPSPSLFAEDRRYREVLTAVDALRDRFGEDVLTKAKTLTASPGRPVVHHGRPAISRLTD